MIRIDKQKHQILSYCHYKYLQALLKKRIESIIKETSIKIKNKDISINQATKNCLEYIKNNLQKILLANAEELKELIKYFEANYPCLVTDYKREPKPPLYLIVYKIFVSNGYSVYFSKTHEEKNKKQIEKKYHAYKFIEELNIGTCPYCNRNYISSVSKDKEGDKKTRPEIDHFYPKAIYPFLACSFYNLIPSCKTCNHMKSDDDSFYDGLMNPYEMKEDTFKFSYDLNSVDILNIEFSEKYEHKHEKSINIIFDKKNETNEKYFELEKLYNQEHRDIVIELLVKKAYYPQSYIKELSNFGFSQDEIYRYLFSNYNQDEDLHKRPLSKLVKDISNELGLI
jgi:hypothetical protein